MALDYIQMPADGVGKKVQAWSNALGPGTLYSEAITITDSTGVEKGTSTNPVRVDPTGVTVQPVSGTFWQTNQPTTDAADMSGTAPGTAPSNTIIVGAKYNSAAPAPTNGQTLPLQTNSVGQLLVAVGNTPAITGTVTANAGTNLNTSLLALETGGNLAIVAGAVTSSIMQSNIAKINNVTPLMGNGVTGTGSQRVTIASDNTPFTVNTQATGAATLSAAAWTSGTSLNTVFVAVSNSFAYNAVSFLLTTNGSLTGGAAVTFEGSIDNTNWNTLPYYSPNSGGVTSTGIFSSFPGTISALIQVNTAGLCYIRVRLSTVIGGSNTLTIGYALQQSDTAPMSAIVSLPTNASVNLAQIASANIATATTGVAKVGIVGNTGATLDAASGSGAPTNTLQVGGKNSGNLIALNSDASGNIGITIAASQTLSTVTTVGTVTTITNAVSVKGNAGGAFDAATNAAPPANAIQVGMVAATALPSAFTATDLVPPMTDKFGRQVVVANTVRDLVGFASVQTTDTSSHNLIAAGGSGVFTDITYLLVTNENATTATVVSLSDGTVIYKIAVAAAAGASIPVPILPATSTNTAWTVTSSAGINLDYIVTWCKNK